MSNCGCNQSLVTVYRQGRKGDQGEPGPQGEPGLDSPFQSDGTGLTNPENWRTLLGLPQWLMDFDDISITDGDELEMTKNGITYYIPLYRRA